MSQKFKILRAKEAKLGKLQEELKALENDKELRTDLKLRDEVEALLKKYNRPTSHLAMLFDLFARAPYGGKKTAAKSGASTRKRRRRKLKIYTNPHSGEKIETRGANHKVLKDWKTQFGGDVVETWLAMKD